MQRRASARRALAVLLSITLVVGLWPGGAAVAAGDTESRDSGEVAVAPVGEASGDAPVAADVADVTDATSSAPSTSDPAQFAPVGGVPADDPRDTSVATPLEVAGAIDSTEDKGPVDQDGRAQGEAAPAIDYLGRSGGLCVRLHAPEGAFPAGTVVGVRPADGDEVVAATEGLLSGDAVDARAVDISFVRDGVELQPAPGHEVRVSLLPDQPLQGECFSAVHLSHGSAEVVAPAVSTCATFSADSFSIYGIVGENASRRLQVTFKSGGATLSTQIVREGDTLVVPDPSASHQQQKLYYWEVGDVDLPESYLGRPLTSDDIDRMIATLGAVPLSGDNIWGITASAVFDEGYRAYFHKNARGHELAEIVADSLETDMGLSVDLSKATFVAPDPTLKLVGWDEYDDGGAFLRRYSTSGVVTLSDDVHYYPALATGIWVSLDLSPAATQPNVFAQLVDGETRQWRLSFADLPTASDLGESYCQGYTFGGWFRTRTGTSIDDYEYEDPVTEDVTLTSASVTLYAKWVPADVTYSVVHWVEGPERGPGEGDYTIFATEAKSGKVGTAIPVTEYAEIDSDAGGYHIAGTDDLGNGGVLNEQVVTITRDGAAVKNVYHNRNRVKPTFKKLNNGAVLDPGMDGRYENYIKWGEGPDYWDPNGVIDGYLEGGHSGNTYYLFSGGNVLGKTTQFSNERGWTYTYPYYPLFSLPDKTAFTYTGTTTWTARSVTQDRFYFEVIEGEASPDDIEVTFGGQTLTLAINPDRTFNENSSIQASQWAINKNPNTTKFMFEGFTKWAYRHGVSQTNHSPVVDPFLTGTANVRPYLGDDELRHIDWFYTRNRYTLSYANVDGVIWPEGRTQPEPRVVQYGAALAPHDPGLSEGSLRSVGGKTYAFDGWYRDAGAALSPDDPQSATRRLDFATETMGKDTVAYAAWRPLSFTLAYESNGGTPVDPVVVESGERAEEPVAPTKSGATFVGWFKDEACTIPWDFYTDRVTADATLHAKWISGQPCSLSYHKAGGDPVGSDATRYYSGTRVKLDAAPTDATQTGAFLGWSTIQGDASGLVQNTFTIYDDTHLYAVYGDAPETGGPEVTLDQNQPGPGASSTYGLSTERVNDQVTLPGVPVGEVAAPRGYGFVDWNTEADGSGESWQAGVHVGVSSATRLYAQWEPLQIATPTLSASFVYDGRAHEPRPDVKTEDGEPLLEGEDYALSYDANVHPTTDSAKATVTITPTETGRVWLADPVTLPFDIGKATLDVTPRPVTITYGEAARADGVDFSGFVEGEGPDVLSGELAYSFERRLGTASDVYPDAGTYDIVASGLASSDYQFRYLPGTLTVEPREVSLDWARDVVYSGDAQRYGGARVTDTLAGDEVVVSGLDGAATATDVGTYLVQASALSGAQGHNYRLPADPSHEWRVLKAPNSVSAPEILGWAAGSYDVEKNAPYSWARFAAAGEPAFEYRAAGEGEGEWSPEVPSEPGRYEVRALVADTANYEAATSEPTEFVVTEPEVVPPAPEPEPETDPTDTPDPDERREIPERAAATPVTPRTGDAPSWPAAALLAVGGCCLAWAVASRGRKNDSDCG
ncbi:InlB B-repeat-containing protein [Olsenella intestinalis]|uniref:InlB B-repeat-containing protein n=1 Tax=Olsenella intestinalis TaxID=2930083 RepID=UPI0020103E09|nr:InlB B-repeat-containing protein [Olsenella intestinalis]